MINLLNGPHFWTCHSRWPANSRSMYVKQSQQLKPYESSRVCKNHYFGCPLAVARWLGPGFASWRSPVRTPDDMLIIKKQKTNLKYSRVLTIGNKLFLPWDLDFPSRQQQKHHLECDVCRLKSSFSSCFESIWNLAISSLMCSEV